MELWIPITIGAAFMQNLRSALQKKLKGSLSTGGATYARFIYAMPLAILYLFAIKTVESASLPATPAEFFLYAGIGGTAQMVATSLLIALFSFRNFAVGTAYSKTEALQAAIFGIVILGDPLTAAAAAAIGISLIGVVALSVTGTNVDAKKLLTSWTEPPALIGMASGGLFGVSAVCYRAASLSLESGGFGLRAAMTLACVLVFQTIAMGIYLAIREPGQFLRVVKAWRVAAWVGVVGMLASAGWFTAMTLKNAAYVRALGQIELVFTFAAAHFLFREKSSRYEVIGIALVISGILLLLIGPR